MFLSLSCNHISILYMFGARVVLMQWVVLCLCLGRKKGMERGTLGATTDTSAWSCFHHLVPHDSTWAFKRGSLGIHRASLIAFSSSTRSCYPSFPHNPSTWSHPQRFHFHPYIALLNGAAVDAVFIFSWIVTHVRLEVHISWKTRLLMRVSSK